MKIINVHQRILNQSKKEIGQLIETLSTKEDKVWPKEQWPKMRLDKGLKMNSKGGHRLIKYTVSKYLPKELIEYFRDFV